MIASWEKSITDLKVFKIRLYYSKINKESSALSM
jgi:hypothetical protein